MESADENVSPDFFPFISVSPSAFCLHLQYYLYSPLHVLFDSSFLALFLPTPLRLVVCQVIFSLVFRTCFIFCVDSTYFSN
jgi:hypothetical protein